MVLRKIKKILLAGLTALGDQAGKKITRAGLLVLLLLLGLAHLQTAFLAQLAMNRGPQMARFSHSLTNPDGLAVLAGKEHLSQGNLNGALRLYQRSLAHFVLHVPSWLGVVELFIDLDRESRAVSALRFVDDFAANRADIAWTKAILAHELDLEDVLAANLVWLADNHPGKTAEIFSLAELRWPDPEVLMGYFSPALYGDLLRYYMKTRSPDKAEAVWREIEQASMVTGETALAYVNFLLQEEKIEQAGHIWNNHYQPDDSLLFNPGLKQPFTGSGFAWQISGTRGVSWQPASDNGGLRIGFDGKENAAFQLRQIVPLAPGPYVFSGYLTTRDLTTDQLPYWSISGYKCQASTVTAAMPPATMNFSCPSRCRKDAGRSRLPCAARPRTFLTIKSAAQLSWTD